jgi:HD-GYP domain-containing protein (c-di-GMP phosphodiesterase class II)
LRRRCEQLAIGAWLCGAAGEVLRGPEPATFALSEDVGAVLAGVASRAQAEPKEFVHPLTGGYWAIPLWCGHHASGAGIIVAIPTTPMDEAAAGQTARIVRWMFEDLCKSVKDDQVNQELGEKLTQSYEEVNLLFRLSRCLNSVQEPEKLVEMVCGQIREILPLSWVGMCFSETSIEVPQLRGRTVFSGHLPAEAANFTAAARRLTAQCDSDDWTKLLPTETTELGRLAGATVLAEPITHDGRVIGTLFAGGKVGPDPEFVSGEMRFLDATADFLGIFHENLARFAEQRAMFLGTLKSLTAAIDAKDPYTCGHSERVALLSRKIAAVMGKRDHELETYYVSGLVHDIGKIGVPEAILAKRGKLDAAEFQKIQRHPEIGYRILKDIPAMAEILPGVRHHHERWDGHGYCHGLSGEEIPLQARVIAVADSFDATIRSYRAERAREQVLAEIKRCAGTQFDPRIVEAFLTLDLAEFDQMLATTADQAAA